ncbi:MAG: DIP1984 family protein [Clostridia bacterium]|nr:DIP1984 family protein [Clostridia bacterium]
MKLAEALMDRKAIKNKMEELKKRIYQNAQIQEGDIPIENPLTLIEELKCEVDKFEKLIIRINDTNNTVKLENGMTLMEAIVKKDMLNYLYMMYKNLADKATPTNERYSQREIKNIPNVNITEIRKKADDIAKEYRMLDSKIQEANWRVDLI